MKNEKLDWLKAVKERPEDAAAYIEWAKRLVYETEGFSHPYCASQPLKRLRAAARVQTVEEADRACAEYFLDRFGNGYAVTEYERELMKACREARAREAEEEGK